MACNGLRINPLEPVNGEPTYVSKAHFRQFGPLQPPQRRYDYALCSSGERFARANLSRSGEKPAERRPDTISAELCAFWPGDIPPVLCRVPRGRCQGQWSRSVKAEDRTAGLNNSCQAQYGQISLRLCLRRSEIWTRAISSRLTRDAHLGADIPNYR